MAATRGRATWLTGGIWIAIAMMLLAAPSDAYATPRAPIIQDAVVYEGGTSVIVRWTASTDAEAGEIQYEVYRDDVPMTIVTYLANGDQAVVTTQTVATVAPGAGELAGKFTYYYVVVATNTTTGRQAISSNVAPNVHGATRTGYAVSNCQLCHGVHGAPPEGYLGAATRYQCYRCHGDTDAATDYGAQAIRNVQRDFYDYTSGQTIPATVSRHYNQHMIDNESECTVCHTPHKSPYYVDPTTGIKLDASSFTQLLRAELSEGVYYYSKDSAPSGNAFCLQCHGSSTTVLDFNAGTGAYERTAGDHTYAANAAHGPAVIYTNDDTHAANPGIQCEACHNKHASAADKLIAYRGDDSSSTSADGTYAQAELCYACHSAGSSETRVAAGYSAPYAWNDRDVQAQFTGGSIVSRHPTTTAADGRSLTCVNCHNVHVVTEGGSSVWSTARVSTPSNTNDTPASITEFCLDCHDGAAAAPAIGAETLVPYLIGFSDVSAYPYFASWDKSTFTSSGHYTASTTKALCQNCHDPHASSFARLTAFTTPDGVAGLNSGARANASIGLSREQNLCYQCHGNESTTVDGVTSQRASDTKDVITKSVATYGHKPAATTDLHDDTESAADLGASNRHAECEDCHNPHYAKKVGGTATQDANDTSIVGGAVYGVYGAKPTYQTANWGSATTYTPDMLTGDNAAGTEDFEAYLCFKCHSTNTTQPATVTRNSRTYTTTDVARDFNPSNFSYHNVLGQSVGMQSAFTVTALGQSTPTSVTWQVPTIATFASGWGPSTMMTCTSCHTNDASSGTQAKGPHGSSAEWAIDPAYGADWKTAGLSVGSANGMEFAGGVDATNIICAKCHDLYDAAATVKWSNTVHNDVRHYVTHANRKYCVDCHVKVPHGWSRPRLLGYTTDPGPYTTTGLIQTRVTTHTLNANGLAQWACQDCKTNTGNAHTQANSGQPAWP